MCVCVRVSMLSSKLVVIVRILIIYIRAVFIGVS